MSHKRSFAILPGLNGLCITMTPIEEEIASAIVCLLPTLKYLTINDSIILYESLLMIVRGINELVLSSCSKVHWI